MPGPQFDPNPAFFSVRYVASNPVPDDASFQGHRFIDSAPGRIRQRTAHEENIAKEAVQTI